MDVSCVYVHCAWEYDHLTLECVYSFAALTQNLYVKWGEKSIYTSRCGRQKGRRKGLRYSERERKLKQKETN